MRVAEVPVYKFEELSDEAKETARNWWREDGLSYDWWDFTYCDFEEICQCIGIWLRDGTRGKQVYFEIGRPGEYVVFAGSWSFKEHSLEALDAYAPKDDELRSIAARLDEAQRQNGNALSATVSIAHNGARGSSIDVDVSRDNDEDIVGDADSDVRRSMEDLADWLMEALKNEEEYLLSDEAVDEVICANEYEFTACGEIF